MKKKQPVPIPDSFLSKILDHAEREYPRECCGMILSRNQNSFQFTRLVFCRNVQDRCHEEEPKRFPETSEKAYWVDPRQLLLQLADRLRELIFGQNTDQKQRMFYARLLRGIALVEGEMKHSSRPDLLLELALLRLTGKSDVMEQTEENLLHNRTRSKTR